jgi:hypothetical protein
MFLLNRPALRFPVNPQGFFPFVIKVYGCHQSSPQALADSFVHTTEQFPTKLVIWTCVVLLRLPFINLVTYKRKRSALH